MDSTDKEKWGNFWLGLRGKRYPGITKKYPVIPGKGV
jgi:hypothetical protein